MSDNTKQIDENIQMNENLQTTNNLPESTCLALTVRKEYNLTIVKNIFSTSGRLSLKVILSTFLLNLLYMLF